MSAEQFVPGGFGDEDLGPAVCASKAGLNTFRGFASASCRADENPFGCDQFRGAKPARPMQPQGVCHH